MGYGLILLIIAIASGAGAALVEGWGFVLLWPAVAFGAVGAGYCGLGPVVFGKGHNGKISRIAVVVLFPYLAMTWTIWHAWRLIAGSPAYGELAPGVRIGRRLLPKEFPSDVTVIIDLTCEFFRSRPIGSGTGYLSVPILDAQTPAFEDLMELVKRVVSTTRPTYIHCANGHGRTALVAASILLEQGGVESAEEAVAAVREVRAGARLSRSQMRMLERVVEAAAMPAAETA